MEDTVRSAPSSTPAAGSVSRKRRWVRVLLWSLVALPFLAVVAWVIWDRQGVATLEAKIAHLEARGFATSLESMAPPPVPLDQNAAPLYEAAFTVITKPRNRDTLLRMRREGLESVSKDDLAWVEAWIRENRATIRSLDAALTRPHCQFDFDRSRCFLSRIPKAFEDHIQGLSDLLCAHAIAVAAAGHHEEARRSVRQVLRLSESMIKEPLIGAPLVRFGMSGVAMKTIEMCIDERVPDSELEMWASLLPEERSYDGMTEACIRGLIAGMADAFKNDLKRLRELIREEGMVTGWDPGIPLPWKPALYYDLTAEFTDLAQLAILSRSSFRESWMKFDAFMEKARQSDKGWSKARGKFLSMLPFFYKIESSTESAVSVVRAGIEFERAYIAVGRYPDSTPVDDPFSWGDDLRVDLKRGFIFSDQLGFREEVGNPSIRWKLKRRP